MLTWSISPGHAEAVIILHEDDAALISPSLIDWQYIELADIFSIELSMEDYHTNVQLLARR